MSEKIRIRKFLGQWRADLSGSVLFFGTSWLGVMTKVNWFLNDQKLRLRMKCWNGNT